MRTSLWVTSVSSLVLCSCTGGEGEKCGTSPACVPGYVCVSGECLAVCTTAAQCPSKAYGCVSGHCEKGGDECAADADCSTPGICHGLAGASCDAGRCTYLLLQPSTPCNTGDGCMIDGRCDASGTCVPVTSLSCTHPPEPRCAAGVLEVSAPTGTCSAGACSYATTQFSCPDCASCLASCWLDTDGDGTPQEVAPGTHAAGDGCEVCDPAASLSNWTGTTCSQAEPRNPCRAFTGVCDPAQGGGACVDEACCTFAPVWPESSTDPQPACPRPGEDPDGDGQLATGETWTGVCDHAGGCVQCTSDARCDDQNVCTEDSCSTGSCVHDDTASLHQACTVTSPDDGVCERPPTGGPAWCGLVVGQPCSADAQCSSGACECAGSACTGRICADAACPVCQYTSDGTLCTPGLGTDEGVKDGDCTGTSSCYTGGECKSDVAVECGTGADCGSGYCVCHDPDCGQRICSGLPCPDCLYSTTGQACDGSVAPDVDCTDASLCTYGTKCNGEGLCSGGVTVTCTDDECHTRTCNDTAACTVTVKTGSLCAACTQCSASGACDEFDPTLDSSCPAGNVCYAVGLCTVAAGTACTGSGQCGFGTCITFTTVPGSACVYDGARAGCGGTSPSAEAKLEGGTLYVRIASAMGCSSGTGWVAGETAHCQTCVPDGTGGCHTVTTASVTASATGVGYSSGSYSCTGAWQ